MNIEEGETKLCRVTFWFRGTFHSKPIRNKTIDIKLTYNERWGCTKEEAMKREADDKLQVMVIRGLLDCQCDHMVQDFGVEKVETEFKGKPDFKF